MREHLEQLLLVLAVGSAVAIGAKRVGIPYNVALVVVGLLLVLMDALPNTPMDPQVVLIVFLPVLVFEGALFADGKSLRNGARPILALAVPGVALSLMGTAAVAMFVLQLPFAAALLLGALLSITDTVSVLLAFRSVRVPHRLAAIMEGESLFNDGTALVLVSLAAAVLARGYADPATTARALVVAIVGGALLGGLFGLLGSAVLRRTPDHLTAILASLVLVFSTSLVAERAHASPVIAVVVAGLMVGHAARTALEPSRVLALHGFWETAGFALNVWIFLLVGMQLRADVLLDQALPIGLALLALHAGRAIAVYGTFGLLRATVGEAVPMRWQHVMVFGNIKGALSMAAVLALPASLPHRDELVAVVFGVTLVTLVTQALPFRKILILLKAVVAGQDAQIDQAKATLISARRAQKELDELLSSGLVSRKDHAERWAAFQRRIIDAERNLRGPSGEVARDHIADMALLNAQKSAVLDAARSGLISPEVAEAQVSELDRELLESTRHEDGKDH